MSHPEPVELVTIYPVSSRLLAASPQLDDLMGLPEFLSNNSELYTDHPFLPDLAAVERAWYRVENSTKPLIDNPEQRIINPSLELVPVHWQNLIDILLDSGTTPRQGEDIILVFTKPGTENAQITSASGYDLLKSNALKLFVILLYTPLALVIFFVHGDVDIWMGLVLAVGNMTGAWIGTKMAVKRGTTFIRYFVLGAILLAATMLVLDALKVL